jgi:putative tricarboxylic transport membrane protein
MFIGNFILLLMNLPLVKVFVSALLLPNWILIPGIMILSVLGVYTAYSSILSLFIMMAIGVMGYLLRKLNFDMAPIILGFVLGKVMEVNLRNALALSGGEVSIFFTSTLSQVMWAMAIAVIVLPWYFGRKKTH